MLVASLPLIANHVIQSTVRLSFRQWKNKYYKIIKTVTICNDKKYLRLSTVWGQPPTDHAIEHNKEISFWFFFYIM